MSTTKEARYLDDLNPVKAAVGYGSLGQHGNLGYERKKVVVKGKSYAHALSTHPPARVRFHLGGQYRRFQCQVALNDDVPRGRSHADFLVKADGRLAAGAYYVQAGEGPRTLCADIEAVQTLELVVDTSHWAHSHAVWLEPQLDTQALPKSQEKLVDCLARVEIEVPARPLTAHRCIATVVSPGFETLLDDMLGSLYANGQCPDALVVVFVVDGNEACERVVAKYGATPLRCHGLGKRNQTLKSVLYSVGRVVEAMQYLCLDADMLVLGDLRPLFSTLEMCPRNSILACREGNGHGFRDLEHVLTTAYGGKKEDLAKILGTTDGEGAYRVVVNDGLFAGGHTALLALDGLIRAMPGARAWVDEKQKIGYRNQFIFNLALSHMQCGVELDATNNVQLHVQDVKLDWVDGRMRAQWQGRAVRVLHFSGAGRRKYPKWSGLFASVPDPLIGKGHGDGYAAFVEALRSWVGRFGRQALIWSFYGLADGKGAAVNDPATFPVLAMLHALIRANGCIRVLETGTARGVSAACLASAVAHRDGGQVVTIDIAPQPEREALWALLPAPMRACIEQRTGDAVTEMTAALARGERYEAALIDSDHTTEQAWAEFQYATQLVCPGGLILIHDVTYEHGQVAQALARIEAAGYNVVRLLTAEAGIQEDDALGLALIENRRRAEATTLEA